MKIIKNILKKIELKSKLDLITELLILENSTEDALELFEKVKANFIFEMKRRERQSTYECRLVNSFTRREIDPNFDKPISEIKVNL